MSPGGLFFRPLLLAAVAPAHPCARDIRASLHSTKERDPGVAGAERPRFLIGADVVGSTELLLSQLFPPRRRTIRARGPHLPSPPKTLNLINLMSRKPLSLQDLKVIELGTLI